MTMTGGRSDISRAATPLGETGSRTGLIALALGVLGAVVSSIGSWIPSLWTDESATISGSGRSAADLWAMAHNIDAVHATYYFVLHGWTNVFGISAMSLRLPSALAVGCATAGVYLLGRRLVDPAAATWAAVVFLFLPRVTWMGVEARPWALATAAGVWLTLLLVVLLDPADHRWTGRRRLVGWAAYSGLAALAILLNIYLVFVVVAHGVTQLVTWRRIRPSSRWAWFGAAAVGALIASPILLMASGQSGQLGGERFGPLRLLRNVIFNQYALGETPSVSDSDQGGGANLLFADGGWRVGSLVLGAILAVLVVLAVISLARRGCSSDRGHRRSALAWTLPWIVVPTVILGAYAIAVAPLYSPRYLAFTTPALALLVAVGLTALHRSWLRVAVLLVLVVATLPVYLSQRQVNAKSGADWSQVAAVVQAGARPGDGAYFAPRFPEPGPTYGQSTRGIAVAYPEQFADLSDLTLRDSAVSDASLTGRSVRLQDASVPADINRIWVIRRNGDPAGTAAADEATLRQEGFVPRQSWTGTLDNVQLFER